MALGEAAPQWFRNQYLSVRLAVYVPAGGLVVADEGNGLIVYNQELVKRRFTLGQAHVGLAW